MQLTKYIPHMEDFTFVLYIRTRQNYMYNIIPRSYKIICRTVPGRMNNK